MSSAVGLLKYFHCSPKGNISVPCVVVRIFAHCILCLLDLSQLRATFAILMCLRIGNRNALSS